MCDVKVIRLVLVVVSFSSHRLYIGKLWPLYSQACVLWANWNQMGGTAVCFASKKKMKLIIKQQSYQTFASLFSYCCLVHICKYKQTKSFNQAFFFLSLSATIFMSSLIRALYYRKHHCKGRTLVYSVSGVMGHQPNTESDPVEERLRNQIEEEKKQYTFLL